MNLVNSFPLGQNLPSRGARSTICVRNRSFVLQVRDLQVASYSLFASVWKSVGWLTVMTMLHHGFSGKTRVKCPDASSLLVCEATERSTCRLSLLHTLVEGTEEERKERWLLQVSQWSSENAVWRDRRPSSLALARAPSLEGAPSGAELFLMSSFQSFSSLLWALCS